ncbi:MAG: hypothetical protein M3N18_01055 [Actinomycetota bacterium]|nr:hypothetical protein [Actinomycetota bacterium]
MAVHPIGLCLVLERGYGLDEATEGLRRALAQHPNFVWFDPPGSFGPITVFDV